tara:strand:+ start:1179 stop:1754 length:576 start_codon:yes stop_codon:yes gene_type:complete
MKQLINIRKVRQNPNNPRIIKDHKFKQLVESIKTFPKMLEKRAIVVDENMIVLGGNMRLKACVEAGLKEVWIDDAEGWTEDEKKEFIVKDNIGFGQWDWDVLANEWDTDLIEDWGLDVWQEPAEVDYSILDTEDITDQLDEMTSGVKKAIQIEFNLSDHEEAVELVKYWRDKNVYIGGMIMKFLKLAKDKE